MATKWKADQVVAHRWSEPFAIERDRRIEAALEVPFRLFEGETLHPPGTIRSGSGTPYTVFGAFRRNLEKVVLVGMPKAAPRTLPPVPALCLKDDCGVPHLQDLKLNIRGVLQRGGEARAKDRLKSFISSAAKEYHTSRDRLDKRGTSRLSADLKFGTLSVRTVWHTVQKHVDKTRAVQSFQSQLIWRDFAHSTVVDFPRVLETPFRKDWLSFPWVEDEQLWTAWVEGRTGYPVVDAAARQLLGEGYVHGRARMIAASFLTKHLCMDYRKGESHYQTYLTDGDWAVNNFNWQWSAGCGMDAQPWFRIFNPVLQSRKFDPEGTYIRRWVPELKKLDPKRIHTPWEASDSELRKAGIKLDETYPKPVVEHREARERFLQVAKGHLSKVR
jgi:deoxyribodipyrimidine photo-lyase